MTYLAVLLVGVGILVLGYLLVRLRKARGIRGAPGAPISRRHALRLGAAGAASLATGSTGVVLGRDSGGDRLEPGATGQPLRQPEVWDVTGDRREVELAARAEVLIASSPTMAFGYNGQMPGPTLRVRPGDELLIRLRNDLREPTNLHTHGLRVSPEGKGDNPFVRVDPGEAFEYRITIPDDHPAGTFWYHPHHHGNAADQQFGGLAGALLVVPKDTAVDAPVTDVPVGSDLVLVVADITLLADGTVAAPSSGQKDLGREGDLVLVNGQHRPTIPSAPGATARWRVVNACTSRVLVLRLDGHELTQIALDGSFLPAPLALDTVVLAPGNRADLVVRAGAVGGYDLISEPYDRGRLGTRTTKGSPVTLARFVVAGEPVDAPPLPSTLADQPPETAAPTRARQVEFTMRMGSGHMTFGIDDRGFDMDRVDHTVALGATEDWFVNNDGPLVHPFHLHSWPFLVLASSDGTPPTGVLQDVVIVPARGWTRIRIAFNGHPGRSVFHCHVVDHSDAGMMGVVLVKA